MKRTKIVATIGPKSDSEKILKELSKVGVNVFRLNFSHGTHQDHGEKIDRIRKLKLPGAIMLDTKGPEIRTGEVKDKLFLKVGDKFTMTTEKGVYEDTGKISVNYKDFLKDVDVGDIIVFDSGVMLAKTIKKGKVDAEFEVIEGQTNITTKRHINLMGKPVSLPTVTEQDWKDIDFGIEKNIDMIALSFVRNGKSVRDVKEYCAAKGRPNIQIISKIENFEATQNLEEIIAESDGIMVARGDLACEIPFSKVPALQKKIVALCAFYKKPVIIATQMLLSMVDNIQPTRAEVSDVANAVFEHVDAVMTSDETTKGFDPVNVIKIMAKIAEDTEEEIYSCCCGCDEDCNCGCKDNKKKDSKKSKKDDCKCDKECNCESNCGCGCCCVNSGIISILPDYTEDINAIVVISNKAEYTNNVSTARMNLPIISFTSNETLYNNLHLVWNVSPVLSNVTESLDDNIKLIDKTLKKDFTSVKKYLLVCELDGNLTTQIRSTK